MKKTFRAAFAFIAATIVLVLAGCASASTLMSRGDNVGAIEKLASQLKKKPNDQESADMFVSLYPSEVENRLQYTERNVPDIINEWVTSQGYNSLPSALAARKKAVGSSTFLADDSEIRHLITDMETTQKNLKDLEKIQKAVVSMPYEIGEYDVYFVEKYSDNFSGMAQIADRSMAEFYYELGNAAAPGANRTQKIALFDLYGKVNLYSTGYGNISAKRAEAAYAVAEDYLAGSTIDEKKEAINWFNKANNIVTNYNDTNTRIREANYQIGLLYILKWADADLDNANTIIANEYQIRSDMENAIKYLEASKSYKDASTHIANCRKVLAALDEMHNTSRAAAGTTDSGTTNTGTTNSGTTNTGSTNTSTNTNTGTTTTTTAKPMLLVADTASFTLGSNNKINAAVKVTAQGDISLSAGNISFVSNTAGATVKNITVLKAIDTSFTKYKKRDLSAKTTGYTINFELSKAGSFIFRVADAKGAKIEMSLADGTTDTLSPTYTLSDAKYKELIPSTQTTTPTPSTPTTTVKAPVVLVDSNAKYSVVNKKVNATVNIAVEGDLSVTASNIKFDANTAGATVKSVAPTKAVDTSLTKIQTPVKTKGETTKVTGYTITFELSKAGQIVFRVLDAKGGKVQHNATNGNKDTCSPLYTLTEAEYNKLIPPAQTTPSTPVATKPTMVVDSAPKYSVVSNKVNAALNVIVVGDLALTKDNIKLSTNTAGATVKSVTAQKAVDATLSKSKPLASLKATAKTTGYVITFELAKAGNYSFGVIPSTTAKSATQIEIASIDGKTGTVSPTYTLTEAEYNKLIPPAVTPTPTPVAKPSVLVSNTANYSVVSSKVNATVNIVVLGDLSLTKDNIKLSTNTAGATVKSIGVQNSIDAALSKAPSLNTKQKTAQKTTPYQITFELTKAGNFSFNVVDSTTVKNPGQVSIVTLDGKTGTVSPTYTLSTTEYNKLLPPPASTPSTPATQEVKPVLQYFKKSDSHYPTYEPVVRFPFDLKDVTYTLTKNNIKVVTNNCGATWTLEKETKAAPAKGVTSRYNIVLSNIQKSGDFVYSVLDNAGKVITSNTNQTTDTFSVDLNQVFAPSVMYNDSIFFSKTGEANTNFNVYGMSTDRQAKHIKIVTNTTGATVKSVTRSDNGNLSYMRVYDIIFTGIKTDGVISFYVLDDAGKNLAVVHSVNGDEISAPTRNPTANDIVKYNVKVQNIKSAHQVVYGSAATYPKTIGQVTIPFTLKPSGTAPAFTASNVVVLTNGTGGTVSAVQSTGSNNYNIVISNVTKSGTFQYRLKDANGYTITPEGFKNSGGATHSTAASPAYSIDFSKVAAEPVKVSSIIYKEGSYSTTAAEYIIPFTLENYSSPISMNEINVTKNTTGGTVTVSGTASNAQLIIRNITKSGTFFFTYKDRNTGNVMPRSKAQGGTAITEYTIDINKVWTKPVLQYYKKSASHYPTYEPVVRFPFDLKDVTYTLTKNNIKVVTNNCGATWTLEKETKAAPAKGVTSRYNIVLSNIQKSGDFVYSVLDNAGKVITSNTNQTTDTFSVDLNQVFAPSVMYNDSIFFSKTGEANTNFNVYGMSTDRQAKHIKIVTNTTGATVKSVTRSDNGNLSYMRVYDIIFTGIKTDGVISFYVLDDAGKNLAVVHSVNGDEISAPTRNPTTNDIVKYNVKVQNIKSAHQLVYGSAPGYSTEKGQVTIPFTLKPSGTAPAFTASNVVVLTNGTGGTVSSVKSLGTNSYIVVLDNVTKSGTFQYRLKDANGYTITPEGFKNSGGATHSSAASPTYSIDHSKVADGTSNLRVTYDTGVTYPTTLGTAKVTFTVSDPAAATVSKTSPKDLTSITPPTAGAPTAGIAAATPTTLKMSNVQVLTNGTGGTPSLTHLGSGKYEIVLSNVTKSGTFQFQLKDNGGRLIVHPNFTGTPNTILSPAYSININSVAAGKVKTADKVVYASENNNVVVQVPLTAEGGIVLKQSDFALVTNTCGAKIIRLDRTGTTAKYTLVLSVTKAGKFSFSVTSGSTTPTVYCDADAKYMKKAATKNVSVEFEVSVANGGTLQQKLELLEQVDPFKPATMLDLNSMLQKGTSVNGALQLKDTSGNVYTLKNDTASKDMQKVQERIESDGVLKADALKDKVIR